MIDLLSLDQTDMMDLLKAQGFPAFRGRQLFDWCHKKEIKSLGEISNLPKELMLWLERHTVIGRGREVVSLVSADETTVKFLLEFPEDIRIETVLMRYEREEARNRNTLCVSTQAGCAMGCKFCASALGGLRRNLTVGEILAQVVYANDWLRKKKLPPVSNVVYMGMGEPFQNFDAVMKSIGILNTAKNIGMRRITVSTSGLVPQIDALTEMESQITLAVSLHAPNDALRNQLMPINKRYPLAALMAALDRYTAKTHRRVTLEYALFAGHNDSAETAKELAALLKGRLVHVNLLQGNPVAETGLKPGHREAAALFIGVLARAGIEATLRESRGLDIDGACGQLRGRYEYKNFNDKR